ncbi:MAG: hypothetical protein HY924_10445 [Elusimicrobia bacterium]|nr:hypothetical protein [Elusimicrobiota bacterium]
MSAIAGYLRLQGGQPDRGLLQRMADGLGRRGRGGWSSRFFGERGSHEDPGLPAQAGLGQRQGGGVAAAGTRGRVSVDPVSGAALVWDGELYNGAELAGRLAADGLRAADKTEAELVLASFMAMGPQCCGLFNGIWALAVWDPGSRSLWLCRDRFGEKPLHYSIRGRELFFASEPSGLLACGGDSPRPNLGRLARYLAWPHFEDREDTFYEGIRQVPPGSWLRLGCGGEARRIDHWAPPAMEEEAALPAQASADDLREVLEDAVRRRLADATPAGGAGPAAIFLSAGLDSNSVLVLARRSSPGKTLHALCARSERPEEDESQPAQAIAAGHGLACSVIRPDLEDLVSVTADIVAAKGEPAATPSAFAYWLLCREASALGLRTALTGTGGDELLAGYPRYLDHADARSGGPGSPAVFKEAAGRLLAPGLRELTGAEPPGDEPFRRSEGDLIYKLRRTETAFGLLPNILWKEDRCGSAFAVQSRAPFLDARVAALAFRLPGPRLAAAGRTKLILRQAMAGLLPAGLLERRGKTRFLWPSLSRPRLEAIGRLLRGRPACGLEVFDREEACRLLERHGRGEDMSWILWRLLNAALWLRSF